MEFSELWKHKNTQHAPQRQNNQLNDCGHLMEEEVEEEALMSLHSC